MGTVYDVTIEIGPGRDELARALRGEHRLQWRFLARFELPKAYGVAIAFGNRDVFKRADFVAAAAAIAVKPPPPIDRSKYSEIVADRLEARRARGIDDEQRATLAECFGGPDAESDRAVNGGDYRGEGFRGFVLLEDALPVLEGVAPESPDREELERYDVRALRAVLRELATLDHTVRLCLWADQ